jgi:VanZ family protein
MSSSRRKLSFWISVWLPVALGICFIAIESTPAFGADRTSGPLRAIFQAIFGPVSDSQWGQIHLYIRKSGHFAGYGLLGLAWLRAWWMTLPSSAFLQDALLALVGTAIIASADEFHQTFLTNRTGTPWDVLIDCCGVLTLELVVYIFMRIFRPKKLARAT